MSTINPDAAIFVAEQLHDLNVDLASALGMDVTKPIPTTDQMLRDVADLRYQLAQREQGVKARKEIITKLTRNVETLREQRVQLEVDLAQARADAKRNQDARDAAAERIADMADERDGLTAQRDHAHWVIAKMREISAHFAD